MIVDQSGAFGLDNLYVTLRIGFKPKITLFTDTIYIPLINVATVFLYLIMFDLYIKVKFLKF